MKIIMENSNLRKIFIETVFFSLKDLLSILILWFIVINSFGINSNNLKFNNEHTIKFRKYKNLNCLSI